jgi:hypothetical protein
MLAESVTAPTARVARRAGSALGELPGAGLVAAPLAVARQRWAAAARDARLVGAATVAAGRLDARSFLTGSVDEAVVWAEREVIPSVIDSLVPHLVAQTVPRIIEGAMPEIRLRVLPVVVDELTADPKVRDLVSEQGRGMIGDAARELRTSAAAAPPTTSTHRHGRGRPARRRGA